MGIMNKEKIEIAAVIATCNRPHLLQNRALKSIQSQTRKPDYLIVVDDSDKKNKPLNMLLCPSAIPVFEKFVRGFPYLCRGKILTAFTLSYLNSITIFSVSPEINTILCLTLCPIDLAY